MFTYLTARFDHRCLCVIDVLACGLLGGCLLAFSPEVMNVPSWEATT